MDQAVCTVPDLCLCITVLRLSVLLIILQVFFFFFSPVCFQIRYLVWEAI